VAIWLVRTTIHSKQNLHLFVFSDYLQILKMKLTALKCSDESWKLAGFAESKRVVSLKDVDILFESGSGGLTAWGWEGIPADLETFCGIPTFAYDKTAFGSKHPNQALSVDHIVLHTNDADYVKSEFAKLNLQPRAQRDDIYPGITQIFFRPGQGPVIEVVVNKDFPKSFLWGTTLVTADIDAAKEALKENASNPKNAVQPGRRILTVRGQNIGIRTNVALMTPHVKPAAKPRQST